MDQELQKLRRTAAQATEEASAQAAAMKESMKHLFAENARLQAQVEELSELGGGGGGDSGENKANGNDAEGGGKSSNEDNLRAQNQKLIAKLASRDKELQEKEGGGDVSAWHFLYGDCSSV